MTDDKSAPEQDENRLIAERRAKLDALRETGQAYPNDFRKDTTAAELITRFGETQGEELEAVEDLFSVAGRMMAKRVMGKIAFVRLQDRSGDIQLMIQRDNLPEGVFQQFKHWDIGDIIAGSGRIMRTQKGELSVRLGQLRLLSKSLRPLPEKYHGLTDTELRYRQRYVDLIMNEESRKVFRTRSRIISSRGGNTDDAPHSRRRHGPPLRDASQCARPDDVPAGGARVVSQAPDRRRTRPRLRDQPQFP
jgi:lysyl-tRNA synthetase class 2